MSAERRSIRQGCRAVIKIDSPHVFGKFRQLNVWQRLTLARLKGLRAGFLQTDRETAAGVATLIDELYAMLGAAVVRETERRKAVMRGEASTTADGAGATAAARLADAVGFADAARNERPRLVALGAGKRVA